MHNLLKCFFIFFCAALLSSNVYAGVKKPGLTQGKISKTQVLNKKPGIKPQQHIKTAPESRNLQKPFAENINLLKIRGIVLKKGIIHVIISAEKRMLPKDYAGIFLKVSIPDRKIFKTWPLNFVDQRHTLLSLHNSVTFNTQLRLMKAARVTATLSKGAWKNSYRAGLSLPKSVAPAKPAMRVKGKQAKAHPGHMPRAYAKGPEIPPITVLEPNNNALVAWGSTARIRWTMPRGEDAGQCGNSVDIYASRTGGTNRILLGHSTARPGENSWTWYVDPENISTGRFKILIVSDTGCTVFGTPFIIEGCDYSVDSVSFRNGNPLARGIDAGESSVVSGVFRVRVLWNKIALPSTFSPGTAWGNTMNVRSKLTGQVITKPASGVNFDYTSARSSGGITTNHVIYVDLPFEFARDDIAHMMTSTRNIPLEFSFVPTGASVDTHASNNKLDAEMKVLHAKVVDLQILFYVDDFTLERDTHLPGTAPIYHYHFIQNRIRVRNAATTVMGRAPADLHNVPVAWYIEWQHHGRVSPLPIAQGRFLYSTVPAEWTDIMHLSGSFSTVINDPDRVYRLRMVIDPDNEYLDANRSDNHQSNTFGNPD